MCRCGNVGYLEALVGGAALAREATAAARGEHLIALGLPAVAAAGTRDLQIVRTSLGERSGPTGAGFMVVDELFGRDLPAQWIPHGSPAGMPGLRPQAAATA